MENQGKRLLLAVGLRYRRMRSSIDRKSVV